MQTKTCKECNATDHTVRSHMKHSMAEVHEIEEFFIKD